MKYIIDVEKIEGSDLWKAKEFNTLVFDKNGLMKLMALEDELGDYYDELRNAIYYKDRKIEKLEHSNKSLKGMLKKEGELLSKAVKDKKELEEKIISSIDDNEDLVERCIELQNENAKLKEMYEENVPIEEVVNADKEMTNQFEHSEREYERLTHTIKSQKGMLKKQGKDISRLQKDNNKLKSAISFWRDILDE